MAAAAIRDELVGRSVRVRSVGRRQADSLQLPDIAAQLLGRPRETLTEDDIVGLFEVMAAREAAESRSVLIIDDAEVLQPSVLEYLRLMAVLAMDAPPQFVFVGRPEFWEVTNRTAASQFKDLITARWELGRLSADATRGFIERLVASQEQSIADVFDADGLAALMQKSDGLFGRIVALLMRARAIQAAQHVPLLTSGVIDAAAAALDGGKATALDDGGASENSAAVHPAATESEPVPDAALALASAPPALPDPAGESSGAAGTVAYSGIPAWPSDRLPPGSAKRPLSLRRRSYAYAFSLVLVLSAVGTVSYWGIPAGAYRTSAPATELDAPASVASPAQSAASGAAAPSQQRTMPAQADIEAAAANQSQLSLSQDVPAAAAQPESSQPTASVANQSAAAVPQADVSIADNAPDQSAPHVTTPDTTVAAVAMPAAPLQAAPTQGQLAGASAETPGEPQAPQAAMAPAAASAATPTEPQAPQAVIAPAAPLPAAPTQEPVAAASAATPTEPQVPQAAMAPATPLPAAPTQGPVAAASAATPTEPQVPQAAMAPATPLPAAPTQEPVAAASAATPTEPQAPQAAVAPAAPLPAAPTQGPVAAASAATPIEPQAPQAAMPSAVPMHQPATAEQAMAELYAARGDAMLEIRDLSAARRFYETAANAGSGRAAMALGRTYDPAFLSQIRAIGLRPDPVLAATWYRRAAELGVSEAAAELRALTTNAAR